ncbi:MAG: hypothetical protein U0518_01725 [Candidatus Gracilibacteria bacterium]
MRFDTTIGPSFKLSAYLALFIGTVYVGLAIFLRLQLDIQKYISLWYFLLESIILSGLLVFFLRRKQEYQYAQPFFTALFFGFFYALVTRGFYVFVMIWDMFTGTPNTQSHILNALSPSQEFSLIGFIVGVLTSFLLSTIIFFVLFFRRQLGLIPPTQ